MASAALPASFESPLLPSPTRDAGPEAEGTSRILMRWLTGLRWAVFLMLSASLPFGEKLLGFHVHYAIALPVIAAVIAFNAVTYRRLTARETITPNAVAAGVAIDLVAIGALLAASGGAANPFSAVFFVHVALAASLLPARTTFALAGLAACLFAALFALPSGGCCPNHPASDGFSAHLYGMWLAFVIAAGLVAYFLTRVRGALDFREREITRLRRHAEGNARFAALGTLAAGTAHELATPLGTIAVLAGEIAGGLEAADASAQGAAIASQVARCRDILMRMQAGRAGAKGYSGRASIVASVRRGIEAWERAHPEASVQLFSTSAREDATVALSTDDVEATICALLDNALHATRKVGSEEAIAVEVAAEDGAIKVVVEDGGAGVAPELQGRLGEPFLTTKEPGEGMGLGLYLIRTLLSRVGGRLEVSPRDPRGTRITLRLSEAGA